MRLGVGCVKVVNQWWQQQKKEGTLLPNNRGGVLVAF
jgi:hypothetical protein